MWQRIMDSLVPWVSNAGTLPLALSNGRSLAAEASHSCHQWNEIFERDETFRSRLKISLKTVTSLNKEARLLHSIFPKRDNSIRGQ